MKGFLETLHSKIEALPPRRLVPGVLPLSPSACLHAAIVKAIMQNP